MFEPEYPIRTGRLLLRPYAPGDVDALHAYHRLIYAILRTEWEARQAED